MKIPKCLIKFVGNCYLHKYPMWFVYKPELHKIMGKSTYRISVHEGEYPIRPEHIVEPGWILVEQGVPLYGLRNLVSELWDEGYTDEAILVEREQAVANAF